MPPASTPKRPFAYTLAILALWLIFYSSFTLITPPLLDDADSVHAEVAREMLLRHDWVTLYANGIRYLEKAPLLYWSVAVCMRLSQLLGHASPAALAVAARIPLALTVLALAFTLEAFSRRIFRPSAHDGIPPEKEKASIRAGLYAALILLSSFGLFLFTRITIPDALLCLWLTLALYAFYLAEHSSSTRTIIENATTDRSVMLSEAKNPRISLLPLPVLPNRPVPHSSQPHPDECASRNLRLPAYTFATSCALAVLTKGLIGLLFPVAIVTTHLLLTRGPRAALQRLGQLHALSSTAIFFAIAAPWHILVALANPTQGHPANLTYALHPAAGAPHWEVPLPTDGNVHGWAWFYFLNEHLLRYLNLRVPHDYDTVPLWLFLGLILIWLMPWSAFLFQALTQATRSACKQINHCRSPQKAARNLVPEIGRDFSPGTNTPNTARALAPGASFLNEPPQSQVPHSSHSHHDETALAASTHLLLLLWAAIPLLFFSFSTRQEYYVLPALPPLAILIALWLASDSTPHTRRTTLRCTAVLLALGTVFAAGTIYFLLHTQKPAPDADLAALLQQNPADYAMSMGHFLDLNANALALFRLPLALAAAALFLGPLGAYLLRRQANRNTIAFQSPAATLIHAANLALAAGAFTFLLAAHLALQIFAPILSSQQLAAAITSQLQPGDLIVIHQEYEYASTLSFYLQRPTYALAVPNPSQSRAEARPESREVLHILTDPTHEGTPNYGRSSNLWYGSFFPDAPTIFETIQSLAKKWAGPQRIFLWQDLANQPSPLPTSLTPVYVIATSGGKEIVSNQRNQLDHP